jgi:hypothetical protein
MVLEAVVATLGSCTDGGVEAEVVGEGGSDQSS